MQCWLCIVEFCCGNQTFDTACATSDWSMSASGVEGFGECLQAALVSGESMLTFAFAAVALELAFRNGKLKPFGFEKQSI